MYHVICRRRGLAGIGWAFFLLALTAANGLVQANKANNVFLDGYKEGLLKEIIRAAAELTPIKRVKRDGYEGGSFGGEGGESGGGGIIQNALLQSLLSQMASSSAPAPAAAAAPAAAPSSDPGAAAAAPAPAAPNSLLLLSMMGGGGGDDDDPNALPYTLPLSLDASIEGLCTDLPFDALTAYNSTLILAFRHHRVYFLSESGQLIWPHLYNLNDLFPTFPLLINLTAALSFQGYFYLFSNDKYVKFPLTSSLPAKAQKVKLISADFAGVPVPVTAAFSMDDQTALFLSGKKMVLYQPANERKVSSVFTPSVAEGLSNLTSAFAIQSGSRRRFLLDNQTMTEIDSNFKVLQVSPLIRSKRLGSGWLECPMAI